MTRGAAWTAFLAGLAGGASALGGAPVVALAAVAVGVGAVFDVVGWAARRWSR